MDESAQLTEWLRALADPTRRHVVAMLSGGARRAGELAASAGVPPAVMSRHLRQLLACSLIDDERSVTDARVRLFFLRREPIAAVRRWFDGVEAD